MSNPVRSRTATTPATAPYTPPATLDLRDVQSMVLYPVGFPFARFCFFRVENAAGGRQFVTELAPHVTDAVHPDGNAPKAWEITVAFSFNGLAALEVPERSLTSFPLEFVQGMKDRAYSLLVDRGESHPDRWEAIWRDGAVHVWVCIQTNNEEILEHLDADIQEIARNNAVTLIGQQQAGALVTDPASGQPTDKEHFGYSDGIGNPDIAGSGWPSPPGSGKSDGKGGWSPLAPGEFVLGVPDEAGEIPVAPVPVTLSKNGTFLAYRKLHENVGRFRAWLAEEGVKYEGGPELLAAKIVGRFRDGTPLSLSPDQPYGMTQRDRVDPAQIEKLTNFIYGNDLDGKRCPMGAHVRRVNPRDSLGFKGVLVDHRRIVRRGMPYGTWIPETTPLDDVAATDHFDTTDNSSRHGVIFMALCASLERQFEFIQREWMNYGNDFRQGNDRDPLLGNRDGESRVIIQGDDSRAPHICRGLPQFITTRGGEYFFVPGLNALRSIGAGTIETG